MNIFSVVGDDQLCEHIRRVRRKLVYIAPGVNQPVAEALATRLDDLGALSLTVIVDIDPEVCRMGYGDLEALEILQQRANAQQLALRTQSGLRLGMLIVDDAMLVYSPTPRLIEAGSTAAEKPNAIVRSATWNWRSRACASPSGG